MAGKTKKGRKAKKQSEYSINKKYANARLKAVDQYMDDLRNLVGKKGDGVGGESNTLIGAIEEMNNEAYNGELQKYYDQFNSKVLGTFKTQIAKMDSEFNVIDKLTK